MDKKKLITYAVVGFVVLLIIWQVMSLFGGGAADSQPLTIPNPDKPKEASLLPPPQLAQKPAPMTEREMQLMKLQQETQAKYLAAVTELQILKISKDIAEIKRDVTKATLENITAQKSIVELLTPKKATIGSDPYSPGLDGNPPVQPPAGASTTSTTESTADQASLANDYKVVSVSKLRGEWVAVLGAGTALYSVKMGDVLPADGSTVTGIDRGGVQLEKNGKTRKLSMVSVI